MSLESSTANLFAFVPLSTILSLPLLPARFRSCLCTIVGFSRLQSLVANRPLSHSRWPVGRQDEPPSSKHRALQPLKSSIIYCFASMLLHPTVQAHFTASSAKGCNLNLLRSSLQPLRRRMRQLIRFLGRSRLRNLPFPRHMTARATPSIEFPSPSLQ